MKDLYYYVDYVKEHKKYGHSKVLSIVHGSAGYKLHGGLSRWGTFVINLEYPNGETMKSLVNERSFVAQVLTDMLVAQGANEDTLEDFAQIRYDIGREDENDSHNEW